MRPGAPLILIVGCMSACGLATRGALDAGDAEAEPDAIDAVDGTDPADTGVETWEEPPLDPGPPDEEAEPSCPSGCSGHGTCVDGACACEPGYALPDCGTCSGGFVGYPDCVPCGAFAAPCCEASVCDAGLECVAGACRTACPPEMVHLGEKEVCIDRYEASRSGSVAVSAPGATPWVSVRHGEAASGCAAAGKRLCTPDEWRDACQGLAGLAYPYGGAFAAHACNDMNGTDCIRDGSGVLPTGSLSSCEGGMDGLMDMSGNVWEWVEASGGVCPLRGGSVDSCADPTILACTHLATQDCSLRWPALGFRCCLTL